MIAGGLTRFNIIALKPNSVTVLESRTDLQFLPYRRVKQRIIVFMPSCMPCHAVRALFRPLRFLSVIAGILATCPAALDAADQVVITEIVASNTTGLRDEDGAYSDWIELFNSGTGTVNLLNWSLTDSRGVAEWLFPSTNLPPGGFLVVFADSKNRRVPGAPLHTSFGLNAGGEYLALLRSDGSIASEFDPFPEQFG